jgi:KipI family sensor histidine kinase inhibitor
MKDAERSQGTSPSATRAPVLLPSGDAAITVEFGDTISPDINQTVIHLAQVLKMSPIEGQIEVVPTYRSLLVIFDPLLTRSSDVETALRNRLDIDTSVPNTARRWRIPVWYSGDAALDLDYLAQEKSMSRDALVALHASVDFRVFMTGFAPGFAYLGNVPTTLHTPRMATPRQMVPAGAIGLGGQQASINSVAGPSGWRFIGQTPVRAFDLARPEPFLFAAGDSIRFYPVTESQAQVLFTRVEAGEAIVTAEPLA